MIAGRSIVHSERTPQGERAGGAHVMLAGGTPLDGERFIHWNFVSSSREKTKRTRQAWRQQTMDKVPGEADWFRCRTVELRGLDLICQSDSPFLFCEEHDGHDA